MTWNLRNTTEIKSAIDAAMEALQMSTNCDEFRRGYVTGLRIVATALNIPFDDTPQITIIQPERTRKELMELCRYP